MNKLFFATIVILSIISTSVFSVEVGAGSTQKQGLMHSKTPLTVKRMNPEQGHHKNTITLSNGVKYKIYPFHGWDLDHWKEGQQVQLEQSRDLLYKTKLINLDTNDSISVKRK